jgi:hypothetical protein
MCVPHDGQSKKNRQESVGMTSLVSAPQAGQVMMPVSLMARA